MSSINNTNFMHTNDFIITLDKFPTVAFFTQKVDIPNVTMGVVERPTQIIPIPMPTNRLQFEPLTVTFKVDEDMRNWAELFDWLYTVGKLGDEEKLLAMAESLGGVTSDLSITVLSNKGNPIGKFIFTGAWPESLTGLNLSTVDSQTTYQDATVVFRYTYFNFERFAG